MGILRACAKQCVPGLGGEGPGDEAKVSRVLAEYVIDIGFGIQLLRNHSHCMQSADCLLRMPAGVLIGDNCIIEMWEIKDVCVPLFSYWHWEALVG